MIFCSAIFIDFIVCFVISVLYVGSSSNVDVCRFHLLVIIIIIIVLELAL